MAGKAFYALKFGASAVALYGTHSGGETVAKSREVQDATRANTMIKVRDGGLEYKDLEIELEDRPANGILLESIMAIAIKWNADEERKDVLLIQYSNPDFTGSELSTLALKQAWCSDFTLPDGDRKSGDSRTMKLTLAHKGSTVTTSSSTV
jgi:hypothetical protein